MNLIEIINARGEVVATPSDITPRVGFTCSEATFRHLISNARYFREGMPLTAVGDHADLIVWAESLGIFARLTIRHDGREGWSLIGAATPEVDEVMCVRDYHGGLLWPFAGLTRNEVLTIAERAIRRSEAETSVNVNIAHIELHADTDTIGVA